jgi:hypothetical protein
MPISPLLLLELALAVLLDPPLVELAPDEPVLEVEALLLVLADDPPSPHAAAATCGSGPVG